MEAVTRIEEPIKTQESEEDSDEISFDSIVKSVNRWSRIINNLTNDILS